MVCCSVCEILGLVFLVRLFVSVLTKTARHLLKLHILMFWLILAIFVG